MTKAHQKDLEHLKEQISTTIAPGRMSQKEALEFLEELINDLESQVEALRDEIGTSADAE